MWLEDRVEIVVDSRVEFLGLRVVGLWGLDRVWGLEGLDESEDSEFCGLESMWN